MDFSTRISNLLNLSLVWHQGHSYQEGFRHLYVRVVSPRLLMMHDASSLKSILLLVVN